MRLDIGDVHAIMRFFWQETHNRMNVPSYRGYKDHKVFSNVKRFLCKIRIIHAIFGTALE